jgi:hypothetical protein
LSGGANQADEKGGARHPDPVKGSLSRHGAEEWRIGRGGLTGLSPVDHCGCASIGVVARGVIRWNPAATRHAPGRGVTAPRKPRVVPRRSSCWPRR